MYARQRLLLASTIALSVASAFVVVDPASSPCSSAWSTTTTTTTTRLHVTYNDMNELDKARAAFESLVQTTAAPTNPVPPLTSAGRHRRLLEIDLLDSLEDSDEAVNELMHLWMHENTIEDAATLEAMETSCSDGLVEEEKALKAMVDRNPHWAEPRVRLATLLFFKGRTEESYRVALEARELKPWHFEICPLLIMLSLRQQDMGRALFWARLGLPSLKEEGPNQRRKEWIKRSVELATEQLRQAERATEVLREKYLQESMKGEGIWQ